MTSPYITAMLVEARGAELRREACTARLFARARCCRPSAVARTVRRAMGAVTRVRTAVGRDRVPVCCDA